MDLVTPDSLLGAGGVSVIVSYVVLRLYIGEKLKQLSGHERRLQTLERNAVTVDKLDRSIEGVKDEVRDGFVGIHLRIDKLFERLIR